MNNEYWLTQLKFTFLFGNFGDIASDDPVSISFELKPKDKEKKNGMKK